MSTKKTAEKATVCAGCEKRDATIKRQAEELDACKLQANSWFVKWLTMCSDGDAAHAEEVNALTAQRDTLQSRIDSFIKTCADIRAVCVDAGIEHADKMATLAAVKALAENAKKAEESKRYIGFDFGGKDEASYCVCSFDKNGVMTVHDSGTYKYTPAPTVTERPSVMPLVILALNLAILGRLLTM